MQDSIADEQEIRVTIISERHILHDALHWILGPHCAVERLENVSQVELTSDQKPVESILILEQSRWTAECLQEAIRLTAKGVIAWLPSISPEVALTSMELGARGILGDMSSDHDITQCVSIVGCGGSWVPQEVSTSLVNRRLCKLTTREAELVTLLASGLRNKEIAYLLGITEGTVKVYLSKIFSKVGVSDRFELALFALRTVGLLPPRPNGVETVANPGMMLQTIPRRVFPLKSAAVIDNGDYGLMRRSA